MAQERKPGNCQLCGRFRELTFHHFVPRTVHSNKWFKKNFTREEMNSGADLCDDCHAFLHQKWEPKELGRNLNSLEKMRADQTIADFVKWVRKKKT